MTVLVNTILQRLLWTCRKTIYRTFSGVDEASSLLVNTLLVPVEVEPTQADPFISPQPLWLRFGLYSNLKSHIYILHTRSLHTPCTVSLLYLQFQCMGRARPLYSWDLRAPPWSLNTRHSDWCHWSPRDQYAARSEYRCSPPSTSTVHRSLYINVSSFSYWIIRTDTHSRAT